MTNRVIVSGLGRSGTKWLAYLMTSHTPEHVVGRHEPHFHRDVTALVARLKGDEVEVKDWVKWRSCAAPRFEAKWDADHVMEANSCLRYTAFDYAHHLGTEKVYHLVRNPVDVIRSFWARGHYSDTDTSFTSTDNLAIRPYHGTPSLKWDNWTRFQKLCWLWVDGAGAMIDAPAIRMEDIVDPEGDALERWLTEVEIPFDQAKLTEAKVRKPHQNASTGQKLAAFEQWPEDWTRYYNRIVRPLAEHLGYV